MVNFYSAFAFSLLTLTVACGVKSPPSPLYSIPASDPRTSGSDSSVSVIKEPTPSPSPIPTPGPDRINIKKKKK